MKSSANKLKVGVPYRASNSRPLSVNSAPLSAPVPRATPDTTVVEMRGVHKTFGRTPVLDDINIAVRANEVLALLGPSGCGKSTILKLLAGFFPPDSGTILLQNQIVNTVPPYQRNLGMVFQEYSLFPHMNVFDNVGFGLAVRSRPKSQIDARVREVLQLVGLLEMGERFPSQLSGGQKQRIAIARALAVKPAVLLCDEPLSNLDAKLRKDILLQLKSLQRETGVTMVYVTHDQEEAVILADRIALLNHGRIEQAADAWSIFERPRTRFGAEFMGYNNFIKATVVSRGEGHFTALLDGHSTVEIPVEEAPPLHSETILCIREERIAVVPEMRRASTDSVVGTQATIQATLADVVYTGTSYVLTCDCGDALVLRARLSAPQFEPEAMTVGCRVVLLLAGRDLRCLDPSGADVPRKQ